MADERSGENVVFERLVEQHGPLVLRTAWRLLGNREDAQDVAQEAFLRLHRNLSQLSNVEAGAWLYRVTVNLCTDQYRSKRTQEIPLGEFDRPSTSQGPEAVLLIDERTRAVAEGLNAHSEKERSALVLREVEGFSTREVAAILGTSEETVRSQICLARGKLRKLTERFFRRRL